MGPVSQGAACTLRGRLGAWRHPPTLCRAGTYGIGLCLVAGLGPVSCPGRCVHFAWQAWHLATCTCILRGGGGTCLHSFAFGMHGTWGQKLSLYLRFAWHVQTLFRHVFLSRCSQLRMPFVMASHTEAMFCSILSLFQQAVLACLLPCFASLSSMLSRS